VYTVDIPGGATIIGGNILAATTFNFTTAAADTGTGGGDPGKEVVADYYPETETIFVDGDDDDVFFYALRFNAEKADKTRWIPIFGGQSIDVTRAIPRTGRPDAIIPIVNATQRLEIAKSAANWKPADNAGQGAIVLKPRLAPLAKGAVSLDLAATGAARLKLDGVTIEELEFRTAVSGLWADLKEEHILVFTDPDLFPTGATLQIRRKAVEVTTGTAAEQGKFAAPQRGINLRIAAQGKAPNSSWDAGKSNMKGYNKNNHEIRIGVVVAGEILWGGWLAANARPDNNTAAWRTALNAQIAATTGAPDPAAGDAIVVDTVIVQVRVAVKGTKAHSAATEDIKIPAIAAAD
jgi:hypothetical protein